jgi:flagellar biosynthesis GTPase FlhF
MRKLCKPIIYEIKNADSFVKNIGKENTKYVLGENFKPIELSKYFYNFFKFIEQEKDKNFNYYLEERDSRRKKLEELLENFEESSFNFFKFTGPTSNDKTTTLLKFAIMYFNLHFLQEKENNLQAIYEYFSSEKEYLFFG